MNYCVLIHLDRSNISFWYQQESSHYEPLSINNGNTLPLYFYAKENDFIVGSTAKERFLNGDKINSFGNYFEIITNQTSFFKVYGNQKPVKFLIYYAVEQYLSFFIRTVLYKTESIEAFRNNFPLRFIFSNDIVPKEKLLVEGIFKESGYDNIESIPYPNYLFKYLISNGIVNDLSPIVLLTGVNGNLLIELYSNSFINPLSQLVLEGEGTDPRVKILTKMIYDAAMASERLSLNEKNELAHLTPYAEEFLTQSSAIPKGDITLSDGTTCWVKIKRKDLNEMLVYYSGDEKIFKALKELFIKKNIQSNNVQFVLFGDAINTDYFVDRLKKKYSNVISTPSNTHDETLNLIFNDIKLSGYNAAKSSLPIDRSQIIVNTKPIATNLKPKVNEPPIVNSTAGINLPPKVNVPPLPKVIPEPSTRVSSPPLPPGVKPPTVQSTRVSSPPLPPGVKPPIVQPTRISPPPVPTGLKPPVVPPTRVGPPPVPQHMKPPPVPSGGKLPPPLPKNKK